MTGLRFDPALPWWSVTALAVVALAVMLWALWFGLRGWLLRGLALAALALAVAGPVLERGVRQPLSDIVILMDDRSSSQTLPGRSAQTDAAVAKIARELDDQPNVETRRVTVSDDADGTLLGQAMTRAIAAEPEGRLAGVIAVTDGQVHDTAAIPKTVPAPVHVLLTGEPADWDRRLVVEEAPAFGLIGQPVNLRVRVEDQGAVPAEIASQPAVVSIAVDGGAPEMLNLPPGVSLDLPVTLEHAGQNVVSIGFASPQGQLTDRNDSAAIQIEGVRDRLRVLLVSGEPHAGERTWRNLLKSDANVDLIHFTILRPPEKMDGVPVNELALIAFPTQELFEQRLHDFDLIIFDRYSVRGILPPEYFDNIRYYVEDGGALLVSSGPEMAGVESLNLSPLGPILPARPTGRLLQGPFLPQLTDEGRRHPVTSGLPGAPAPDAANAADPAHWGRWLRMGEVTPGPRAEVVMTGVDDKPLLMLERVGKGRVAMLTSDQVWLWGRGFEGGGPQLELLRRIAHWSMQEPELEEETLLAQVRPDLHVALTRRTMQPQAGPVKVTGPNDYTADVSLTEAEPGRFTADWQAPAPGLYRMQDGDVSRLVALGPAAPREFEQTVASDAALGPLAAATQGSVTRISDGIPGLRTVREGRPAIGQGIGGDWIGITPRGAEAVNGLTRRPVLPDWGWMALIAALAIGAWIVEARGIGRKNDDEGRTA
ncbi:MAG: hypothetical protein DI498_07120 [Paracoccus denitrificans]|nr:MAG: hypothetical protein DI498_07120 [Paracoccus denitrificans]PZO84579.1 MAG: hypothetical protein DI633_07120 [Paracoccus denitrificans]